ncbi:hypothetical protein [Streptomyces sp. URMC 123]|uniref:hypothetical protein n=1 Tax=Streptomyces sp. URMC 123 TaxID=3423403 RepID=UPI003F1E0741
MSFTDEWTAAKADASTRFALAGTGDTPGGARYGGAVSGLKLEKKALKSLATDTGTLQQHAGTALADLDAGHRTLTTDAKGFASTATLAKVLETWEKRIKDARTEAGDLGDGFRKAGGLHQGNDLDVGSKFAPLTGDGKGKGNGNGSGSGASSKGSTPEWAR